MRLTRWSVGLAGVSLILLAAETAVMFWSDHHLHRSAANLESLAVPGVSRLIGVRSHLVELAACLGGGDRADECATDQLGRIDRELAEYRSTPSYPGRDERLAAVGTALEGIRRQIDGGKLPAVLAALRPTNQTLDELARANVQHLRLHAAEIINVRRRSETMEVILTAIAVSVAVSASIAGVRSMRRHNRFLQTKALELDRFAATVAHDLLGPLAAVGLAMPMIRERNPGDDQTQRLAERSLASVRRVRMLVDGLLEFARAGAQPSAGCTDVGAAIRDAVGGVQREAEEGGVSLTVESEPALAACSPGVLHSILSNLLRNSIKYFGDARQRQVMVRAFHRGSRVCFEVEDTGPGVPDGFREAIFEPYVRLPGSGPSGLGLGLATVKRLVTAHGGAVGVEEGAHGGARFWFDLPRVSDRA